MASVVLVLAGLGAGIAPPARAEGPNAVVDASGCATNTLPANDDGSTPAVPIGFSINVGGVSYDHLYVNNNGNVTFDASLSTYTPFGLASTGTKIIAPFFADVDTRGIGSQPVRYGWGTTVYQGRNAFCVDWLDVGYFSARTDKLNSFQLLLVDRTDTGAGNFDIVMNYDKVQWETGEASGGVNGIGGSPARMGFSDGGGTSFELPGSGASGSFLDSGVHGLTHESLNSVHLGRYVFSITNGALRIGHTVSGRVAAPNSTGVGGALVAGCRTDGFCFSTITGADGAYSLANLENGSYALSAWPPSGSNLFPGMAPSPAVLTGADSPGNDIALLGPIPLPGGTTITNRYVTAAGVPVVFWGEPLTLVTHGCAAGAFSYQVLQGLTVIRSGPMSEGPAGTYTSTIAAFSPVHGDAAVVITSSCQPSVRFDIYIDPSGTVTLPDGVTPIAGATVTLLRSESGLAGTFAAVPAGSAVMSPANRNNPDLSDAAGRYGWDVFPGYYVVQASKAGCHAPGDITRTSVSSPVLHVPPPALGITLRLDCPVANLPPVVHVPAANQTVEATGPGGAIAVFSSLVTVTDDHDSLTAVCTPASGSLFGLGLTVVACRATDAGGLSGSGSFNVTVQDTTPPVITCPAGVDQLVGSVVSLGTATARDLVTAAPVIRSNAPTSFGPGVTTVTWTATDAAGNVARCTQPVRLTYRFVGFDPPVRDEMSAQPGRALPVKWTLYGAGGAPYGGAPRITSAAFDLAGATYQLTFDGYTYALIVKTSRTWTGRHQFVLTLDDGIQHTFWVNFR